MGRWPGFCSMSFGRIIRFRRMNVKLFVFILLLVCLEVSDEIRISFREADMLSDGFIPLCYFRASAKSMMIMKLHMFVCVDDFDR